ncbi:hypothetical protein GOP47_0014961 [Adiantum capillus-veneris]|uniref:Phosphatidic acid phosphatase type 2/haloperoxidase domain-containing protein n=1 Tax=Adiantum capillus-veneris TaxID=13818 RepID=A0A9D4UMG6_ADICA|nr:hypothetical protein GOP47_0014961 [Adiantum capillus-veneris]
MGSRGAALLTRAPLSLAKSEERSRLGASILSCRLLFSASSSTSRRSCALLWPPSPQPHMPDAHHLRLPLQAASASASTSAAAAPAGAAHIDPPSSRTLSLDSFHRLINSSGQILLSTLWLTAIWLQARTQSSCNMELWGLLGACINHLFSKWLKQVVKQPRPARFKNVCHHKQGDNKNLGMPSSHAQSIAFLGAYFFFTGFASMLPWSTNVYCKSGLLALLLTYMAWLRVREGYHTILQVVVGGLIGVAFATLWFTFHNVTPFLWRTYYNKHLISI